MSHTYSVTVHNCLRLGKLYVFNTTVINSNIGEYQCSEILLLKKQE